MLADTIKHHFPDARWNMTGDDYESLQWFGPGSMPTESEIAALPDLPVPVPRSVTRRQGKQQLVIAGLDEQVQAAIDAIVDPTERKLTRIWFDDAQTWERDNVQFQGLASGLGLTEQQVDDLLIAASQL